MTSQPATKQDLKGLLTDLGSDIKQSLGKRLDQHDQRFDHIEKEIHSVKVATADDIADVKEILNQHTDKLDNLLTSTRYQQLEHRVVQLEHALFGDRR